MSRPSWDAKELDNLLTSRGVKRECPACGEPISPPISQNHLIGINDKTDEVEIQFGEQGPALGGARVFACICGNCGYVRLHSESILRNFLAERARDSDV